MDEFKNSANSKRNKRIRNLIIICVMSALLLTVGTYAWFIGMQTVKVNSFEVKIASVDSLSLSLDGHSWSTQLDDVVSAGAGLGTNEFLQDEKEGLKPISTIGVFDKSVSRLKLYEKGSLTATKGGYRLMASRVNNYDSEDTTLPKYSIADGYVVFDLYVMNLSGDAYYKSESTPSNEEAIYLTYNSAVTAGDSGYTASGIENSVRVAFAQVGRVSATDFYTTADPTKEDTSEDDKNKVNTILGITCTTDTNVTGICRDANIWEPNDTSHTTGAKEWYTKTCEARRTASADKGESGDGFFYDFDGSCAPIATGDGKTSAVASKIVASDYVDVYDGVYNSWTTSVVDKDTYKTATDAATAAIAEGSKAKLYQVDTFTDSEKLVTGQNRAEVMTLAPNSITKVRVYIWIEGQDVDNYDFAALGNSIKVNFGFTKEKFTSGEIDSGISGYASSSNITALETLPTSAPTSAA